MERYQKVAELLSAREKNYGNDGKQIRTAQSEIDFNNAETWQKNRGNHTGKKRATAERKKAYTLEKTVAVMDIYVGKRRGNANGRFVFIYDGRRTDR